MPATRSFRISQSGLNTLLKAPTGTVGQHFRRVAVAATKEANAIADAELERGSPPAGYHGGFESHVEKSARGLRVRLSNRSRVAAWVEAGTQPHIIRPTRARVLAWKDRGGEQHFAKFVMHPGTRAYRIMERAVQRAVRRFG